ncbi:MAG TPA: DUF885 domain-containing protein [Thermoanaerobaculia bacterium]|nr:DUF885 domain-containing protein [Thermoanaerobaculia bacterium]
MKRSRALAFQLSLFLLAAASAFAATPPPAPVSESERLRQLFDRAWDDKLRLHPEFATYIGFPGHNDRWSDLSPAGLERLRAVTNEELAALKAIDRGRLTPPEQVEADLFRRRLEGQIEGFRFPSEQMSLTEYGIQQVVPSTLAAAPAATLKDYEDLLARLNALPALVDQNIALMEKGLAAGVTSPKALVQGAPDQVRALLTDDPAKSPLLARFQRISDDVPEDDQARLRQAALTAYQTQAAPAFRKLLGFLTEAYIPHARDGISVGALPNGAEWYAYLVRGATTTDLTPRQVHEIGLAEVKRIRAEMDRIIGGITAGTGFQGSFADFVRFLHTDPRFFYANEEDLVAGYRAITGRADLKIPALFGTVPKLAYRVVPIPANEARSRATAYYEPGSVSLGRPGTCFVNTFDLKARPRWEMEALALHECTPGHHLQVSIAQQIKKPPKVLNYHDYTAFVEGWGVYAETLGDEMGFYQDPYTKFGQLSYALWRSMRLVVDTGIHSEGWTRQQAIDYCRETTAQDDRAIAAEVDRFITSPALALAYKIGELKITGLRAAAQKELGPAFDVRAFHDEVLKQGALPLDFLERNIQAWAASVKGAPAKTGR